MQILRVIDSLQLTAKHSIATPVNWNHGDKVMVVPTLSNEQASQKVLTRSRPYFLYIPSCRASIDIERGPPDCTVY